MFGNLMKAALAVVTLPVAAVVDMAEVVGILDESGKSHTAETGKAVLTNLSEAVQDVTK